MINATLNDATIATMQTFIGKIFTGYTYSPVAAGAYGNVLLTIDGVAYELRCSQIPLVVGAETEDVACLSFKVHHGGFTPMAGEIISTETIEQKITGICIIQDTVMRADGTQISMDMAIIIKTPQNQYMFSRDVWFSEFITISNHDDLDAVYPICRAKDGWKSDESDNIVIKRSSMRL